ncbi:Uncharacterized protein dnl_26760 [Desulfonema limicola]|uniref:Uncharacterized protein n=1 Tax=Desulfonema limicola TaxID=45656 RepID=A0A975B7K3_9BACT|nr:hypothetical protein [Desulfonema limicola]QTA80374.1 Uncharacterized protein dnl_26760 [Desulfonema limicola]
MNENKYFADNLKKIRVSVKAGTTASDMNLTIKPDFYDFIFGIGTNGLTPFEYLIAGKSKGDIVSAQISKAMIPDFFEHIKLPLPVFFHPSDIFYLEIQIKDISLTQNNEIIKAMAEIGGKCGCGCGCGTGSKL